MRNLENLKNGVALEVTLLINNEAVKFVLSVASRQDAFKERAELGFVYYSIEKKLIATFYSGGVTGVGASDWDITELPHFLRIVTCDINEIYRLVELAVKEQKEIERRNNERLLDKVERVNDMEVERVVEVYNQTRYVLRRTDAHYRPAFNRYSISGATVFAYRIDPDGTEVRINFDGFVRKDGILMRSKVIKYKGSIVGYDVVMPDVDAIELVEAILSAKKKFEADIAKVQRG